MRNGVLAITRDGNVAEMNAEAARIFQIKRSQSTVGRHFSEVLAKHPDMVRVLHSAFELSHLPNRAELRLKTTGKVIGYTLSHVRDERGRSTGVALFFKDLTKVEQLEERERLRDRLVALGEMAAAIAHEVKNPLAGIEVMAGPAEAAGVGGRFARRAVDPERHHQRSEDGESDRARGARVRAARSGCRSSTRRLPTCCRTRSPSPKRKSRAARSACR